MKEKPQYNEEDVNALEHVSMLIDEYLCCDDDKLTESGRQLKELVGDFYGTWEQMLRKYAYSHPSPKTPMDLVSTLEKAHKATKNSKLVFK